MDKLDNGAHNPNVSGENQLKKSDKNLVELKSESRFTFFEATSIIVGHGVGSGILSVPFLVSCTRWWDVLWIVALVYTINLLMHFMVAELSYNNGGLQFIKCLERELFVGKFRVPISFFCFALLIISVILNVAGYISGAAAVFSKWFDWPIWVGTLVFYVLAAAVVYVGMKLVGICEKIAVSAMIAVIAVIMVVTLFGQWSDLPAKLPAAKNLLALYSILAFSLSAVMSVPQVVKGLNGDVKKIRGSLALGTGINVGIILTITFTALLGARKITEHGALVDLAVTLGGWVAVIGYLFSLLALATSFWANTLNLRDIVAEQTKFNLKLSWFLASFPCLLVALLGTQTFVGFIRLASVVQVITGLGVIIAYNRSRARSNHPGLICGRFGSLPWQLLIAGASVLATVGSIVKVVHGL